MKAIDLVGRVFRALAGRLARRQHRPHAGPATVALSLRLWQRADRAGRLPGVPGATAREFTVGGPTSEPMRRGSRAGAGTDG